MGLDFITSLFEIIFNVLHPLVYIQALFIELKNPKNPGFQPIDGHKMPAYNEYLRIANWLEICSFIKTDNLIHGIHAKGTVQYNIEQFNLKLNNA